MKITLLGTGTSQGVPVIGCTCSACTSDDTRDDRLRSGVLIEEGDVNILIDTGPDLRQQMLLHQVSHVDAVIYTHEHNDHVIGLDDIRPFNFAQNIDMPIYGLPRVIDEIKFRFDYIFRESRYPGVPRAIGHHISSSKPFSVSGLDILPIDVLHGQLPILGFKIGDFTFITDASFVDSDNIEKIKGAKVLVINALHRKLHPSHFTLGQALEFIEQVQPEKAYLTHISHKMGPTVDWEGSLPENVYPAYDGLTINL